MSAGAKGSCNNIEGQVRMLLRPSQPSHSGTTMSCKLYVGTQKALKSMMRGIQVASDGLRGVHACKQTS
jgi:hypothetical protein